MKISNEGTSLALTIISSFKPLLTTMNPKNFISEIHQKSKQLHKTIVLPDAGDPRALKAARIIVDKDLAVPILIGDEAQIRSKADSEAVSLQGVQLLIR